MTKRTPQTGPDGSDAASRLPTLAGVQEGVKENPNLSSTRKRDLCSAVRRVSQLLGNDPAAIALDMPAIAAGLAAINPMAIGLSPKRWSNVRSDFIAAVKASGIGKVPRMRKSAPSRSWVELLTGKPGRIRIGLSRLAHFCSGEGITPREIDDDTIERFIAAVREGSLQQRPASYHRKVAAIWNELARSPGFALATVTVPSPETRPRRIDQELLPASFRTDVEDHLTWCRGDDPFDAEARDRPLAALTVQLRRGQIYTAVTALTESGVAPAAITSLAFLVTPEALKKILRRRIEVTGDRPNAYNRDLGKALIQIAKEWVEVDATALAELKRLVGKMKVPAPGLTDKNKKTLRQFDDPSIMRHVFELPERLWKEAKREDLPGFRRLAKLQAALALAILPFMPIRAQNLTALTFDTHLFLRDKRGAVSTLELTADEVKNGSPLEFDIPPTVTKMLIEYRDRIAPKIIGHRPARLFVNPDGTPKSQEAVSDLITRTLRRRIGIVLTPHQFRHLSAKLMLDASPGNFITVSQLLGHKNLKTTANAYGGIDSRRAARHHQQLIERKLAELPPARRRRLKEDDPDSGDRI